MKTFKTIIGIVAATCLLGSVPAGAKDWTHVNVGIEGAFPPWNTLDSKGQLSGLDVDLIKDLCNRAAVECSLQAGDWSAMIPSLNAGKFDLIMTLGINEKRKQVVDFTLPYASGVATFIVLKDSDLAKLPLKGERLNLNDKEKADPIMTEIGTLLKGKSIGVIASTSQEQLVNAYFGDSVQVRIYKNSVERDLDLKAGRIDAGFDSGVYGASILSKPGNEDLTMAGPFMKGAMLATEVAMGLRKGEMELKEKFDKAIREAAAAGVIKEVSEKWSKLDLTPSLTNE